KEECATWDGAIAHGEVGLRMFARHTMKSKLKINNVCSKQLRETIVTLRTMENMIRVKIFKDFVQRLDSKVTRLNLGDAEVVAKGQNTSQVVEDLLRLPISDNL
nr:hypothetical protein [Tanacetum cinerariifolium]